MGSLSALSLALHKGGSALSLACHRSSSAAGSSADLDKWSKWRHYICYVQLQTPFQVFRQPSNVQRSQPSNVQRSQLQNAHAVSLDNFNAAHVW